MIKNIFLLLSFHFCGFGCVHKPSNLTDSSTNTYEQLPNYKNQGIRFRFKEPVEMNCIAIQEMIQYGQRIQAFEMILENNGDMNTIRGTTVGRKRIISFPTQKLAGIGLKILEAKSTPIINEISLYKIDEKFIGR
jgi:alpha-L-fucosidase